MDDNKIQITLEAARRNAKLTQDEAGKKINVSRLTIGKWERGESFPDAIKFKMLCEIYRVPMDNIFLPTQTT